MIINLPTKRILIAITVTNISKSFTYKMAAKTSWHRYGTKLRHCRLLYMPRPVSISVHVSQVGRSEFCRNRAGYTEILVNNPPPQMRVIFSGTLSETLDLENFVTASRRYNQQNWSTVELSDHTYDGRRIMARRT